MNREFQLQKRFATPIKPNFIDLKKLTPNSITGLKQDLKESSKEYSDEGKKKRFDYEKTLEISF